MSVAHICSDDVLPNPRSKSAQEPAERWWWMATVAFTLTAVALMIYTARSATAARTPWDENALLQMARYLAGEDNVGPMLTRGYYPGPSLFLAPVWWFTDDATTIYVASNLISNAFGIATMIPLAILARQMGLRTAQAWTVASASMLMVTRVALADYVLSEQFFTFFLMWVPVAVVALWRRPTFARVSAAALAAIAASAMHGRGVVAVAVLAVWLLAFIRVNWRVSMVGIGLLGVGQYTVQTAAIAISNAVSYGQFDQTSNFVNNILSVTPGMLARVTLMHSWAQLVGSLGVVVIGAIALTWGTFSRLFHQWHLGPEAFVWGLALAGMLLSIIAWLPWSAHFYYNPDPEPRLDSWIYSRYADPFVLPAVLTGLVTIASGMKKWVAWLASSIAAAWSAIVVLWAVNVIPTWGSSYGPINSAALYPFYRFLPTKDTDPESVWNVRESFNLPLIPTFTNDNRFWLIASVSAVGTLVIVAMVRRWPLLAVSVVAALWAIGSVLGNPEQARVVPTPILDAIETAAAADSDEVTEVEFDMSCSSTSNNRATIVNWLAVWVSPYELDLVDTAQQDFDSEIVVGCADGLSVDHGALQVVHSADRGYAVWVMPGQLQDALAADGLLISP